MINNKYSFLFTLLLLTFIGVRSETLINGVSNDPSASIKKLLNSLNQRQDKDFRPSYLSEQEQKTFFENYNKNVKQSSITPA